MTDAVVILGFKNLEDGTLSEISKGRTDMGIKLFRKLNAKKLIFSGKSNHFRESKITEAEAMKRYAIKNGIRENNIIKEELSKDTFENGVFVKKITDELELKNLAIVTSKLHLERVKKFLEFIFWNDYKLEFYGAEHEVNENAEKHEEQQMERFLEYTKNIKNVDDDILKKIVDEIEKYFENKSGEEFGW